MSAHDDEKPAGLRQMLAHIALLELPEPREVRLYGDEGQLNAFLTLRSGGDLQLWLKYFTGNTEVCTIGGVAYQGKRINWHGWDVSLRANAVSTPAGGES